MCIIIINKSCFQENSLTNVKILSALWVPNRLVVIYGKKNHGTVKQSYRRKFYTLQREINLSLKSQSLRY